MKSSKIKGRSPTPTHKKNSPDEEIAREAAHEITTELIFDEHAMAQIILAALRKSKTGQEEKAIHETIQSSMEAARQTPEYAQEEEDLGKPDTPTDHVIAVLQNPLYAELIERRARDLHGAFQAAANHQTMQHCVILETQRLVKEVKELLSSQGVGEAKELENEALPPSTQGHAATQTDPTPRSLSDLLPCPFCGVIPTRDKRDGFVRHPYRQGDGCPLNQERDEVFLPSSWNKRAAPSVGAGVGEYAAGVSYPKCPECKGTQFHHSRCRTRPPLTPPSPQVEPTPREIWETAADLMDPPQVEQVSAVQEVLGLKPPAADVNAVHPPKATTKPNS